MGWRFHDLTKDSAGAPKALGRPTSHVVDDVGTERIQRCETRGGRLRSSMTHVAFAALLVEQHRVVQSCWMLLLASAASC